MPSVRITKLVKTVNSITNNMYMIDAFTSMFRLRFTNERTYHPLPDYVTRKFISSSEADAVPEAKSESEASCSEQLELLECRAGTPDDGPGSDDNNERPPILFLHGGFGHASVWLPFMTYLHQHGQRSPTTAQTTYALSLRSHGASFSIPFLRMVYATPLSSFTHDIQAAISHVIRRHNGQPPILVAHSSSGGLVQSLLSRGVVRTPALVLIDAVPHFGNLGVYYNWMKHDPWFGLRMYGAHLCHPISPLSSESLVRAVFFGDRARDEKAANAEWERNDVDVEEFMRWMPKYESLIWPLQMMGSFWGWLMGRPRWLDVKSVISRVDGIRGSDRLCVMVGSKDVLMDVEMCRKATEEYRRGFVESELEKKIERIAGHELENGETAGADTESKNGVRFVVVHGAGHHIQNDVQWKVAAEALRRFVIQV